MTPQQFDQETPRMFTNRLAGFMDLEQRRYRENMEQTRMLMFTMVQPHLDKKHKNKTITDLYPLPWDETQKNKPPRQQQIQAAKQLWDKIDNQKKA